MPRGNAKAYLRQRPARARRVHRAMLAAPKTSKRSPARPERREFELGNAVYSTGPLLIFLLAALLVVGAVSLLALHQTLWMLIVAITVHVVATVLVLWVAMALLDEGST